MPSQTLDSRLWARVEKSDGCWKWRGAHDGRGYGAIRESGPRGSGTKVLKVHREVYRRLVGEIPNGLELDHLCKNKGCCNPSHLEAVTRSENVKRGSAPDHNRRKTHCRRGHEYTPENTYMWRGRRSCRACNLIYTHNRRHNPKACPPKVKDL